MTTNHTISTASKLKGWLKTAIVMIAAAAFYFVVYYAVFGGAESGRPVSTGVQFDQYPALAACDQSLIGTVSEQTVLLRVDDIQAYAWRETQLKIMADAAERNIPLSLGVIPSNINTDSDIVEALRSYHCLHEVALHGYDHGASIAHAEPEFRSLSKDEAFGRITLGLQEIALTGLPTPTTWIPPLNEQSTGTTEAVAEIGFSITSAEGDAYYDYDSSVTDYDTNALFPVKNILDVCKTTFETETECIVMIHPQDFVDENDEHDEAIYQEYYIALLDQLQQAGYTFSTFSAVHAAHTADGQ